MISHEFLRECATYNPEDGIFHWRLRPPSHFINQRVCNSWNAKHSGKKMGTLRKDGYLSSKISGREYLIHRLAWFYVNSEWPHPMADHIDRDRTNNKIKNIRVATPEQNSRNCTSAMGSSSQFLGVSWNKKISKWTAQIRANGKLQRIGVYDDEYIAAHAYISAKKYLHG